MKYLGTFLIILALTACGQKEGGMFNTLPPVVQVKNETPAESMYPESVVKSLVEQAYAIGRNHKIEGCKQRMNDSVKGD